MQQTLIEKFKGTTAKFQDKVALQIKKESGYDKYTYAKVKELSKNLGFFLVNEGFKKEHIAIILENRPEWPIIYFGILYSGSTVIPIDPQLTPLEIKNILIDSQTKLLFTSWQLFLTFNKEIIPEASSLKNIVILDKEDNSYIAFSKIVASYLPDLKPDFWPKISFKDISSIIYTSGTTDIPKAVSLSHKNILSNFESIEKLGLCLQSDNMLSILPLHHSYPFMVTLIVPLFVGATITYIPVLRTDVLLECMRESGVSILVAVPQLFNLIHKGIQQNIRHLPLFLRLVLKILKEIFWQIRRSTGLNLAKAVFKNLHKTFGKGLRFFASGGAKLDKALAKDLFKLGFTILEGYGLTETSPVVTFNPLNKPKIGSVGMPLPDVEVKIANPDNSGIGEIIIKGQNVMAGYYKRPDLTAGVIKDGWFYSGDLGYLDRERYLYITGRAKEVIVLSSGKNIYPEEIEKYYKKSPFIKELCVLDIEREGSVGLYAVVLPDYDYFKKIGEINVYTKIKWELETLSAKISPYKRIMGFMLTNQDLPLTRLGKIKRYELKNIYERQRPIQKEEVFHEEDQRLLSSETARLIMAHLTKEKKKRINLADHLEIDLGIDSLGRIELSLSLERLFSGRIPDNIMFNSFTVKDLIINIEKLFKEYKEPKEIPILSLSWQEILKTEPQTDILNKIRLYPHQWDRIFTYLISGLLYVIFKAVWQLRVYGKENLPHQGPYILCPNHASYLDGFIVASSIPFYCKINLFFLGYRAYFDIPIIRKMIRLMRIIPVEPAKQLTEAMRACSYILREDKLLCIFPEGARSIDAKVKVVKKGIGILAKELDIPLVPVYIQGSYEAWPRTKLLPRPYPIKIIFGQPQTFQRLKSLGDGLNPQDDYEAIALGLREELLKLRAPLP